MYLDYNIYICYVVYKSYMNMEHIGLNEIYLPEGLEITKRAFHSLV
jgi:hypothetical protein